MTIFLRLLDETEKGEALSSASIAIRNGACPTCASIINPSEFNKIPGAPFAYWVSSAVRDSFEIFGTAAEEGLEARQGLATADDFRFVRLVWEIEPSRGIKWRFFSKGGAYSKFYGSIHLLVSWGNGQDQMLAILNPKSGKTKSNIWMLPDTIKSYFFRPGFTWSRRSAKGLSFRALPEDCIFSDKGPTVFLPHDDVSQTLSAMAVTNSSAYSFLVSLQIAAGSYEAGVILRTPIPKICEEDERRLAELSFQSWSLKRKLDETTETSLAFVLPFGLRSSLGEYHPPAMELTLNGLQANIDDITFDLYGFSEADRAAALGSPGSTNEDSMVTAQDPEDSEDDDGVDAIDQTDSLLSWTVGVAFGRFDLRLATGEREAPHEPDPFDPLPAKSPGMLPDGAAPFHDHSGILVDDQGHPHDLPRLIEEVLARVQADVPGNVRRWLQRDFFLLHLKQYSKSRRKAPIYWPLSTSSGSYTLWCYYPNLTSQTLYVAVNDFIEGPNGKLCLVRRELTALREKGSARSSEDEKRYEVLQTLELELIELRDTLLQIAPTYHPNHDDGVQITAAPLWQLFRHKPWQKILKDTWAKLEKGEYDWAHLAMAYWPTRVREKCKTDKSLAIAHDLEHLYAEAEPKGAKARGLKKDAE
ncbi:type II restriction endonuclease subunit M [Novosphingobium sp. ST904]|uniref:type II restriction endonuclease subunit M n=1 Tax=Novosphingobium sp. ST904 TaxID=1684385 RepID=UPI0010436331|nr:type II restriction endonuclease subunit M [Novosphingobium sp. ST904]